MVGGSDVLRTRAYERIPPGIPDMEREKRAGMARETVGKGRIDGPGHGLGLRRDSGKRAIGLWHIRKRGWSGGWPGCWLGGWPGC